MTQHCTGNCCQANRESLRLIEQMLMSLVFPNGVMPLAPEHMRTYPTVVSVSKLGGLGVFESNCFWGHRDDDHYV